MKGKHHIIIETSRVKFEFDIKRNITIIQGDSATGKTTLIDLLRQYYQRGSASGVTLVSDKPCVVYGGGDLNWAPIIESEHDSIFFIDEDFSFIYKKEFAEIVKRSTNYFVIITRKPIKTLPYSINEIYGIRTSGKYHFPDKVYNEFYPIYPEKE